MAAPQFIQIQPLKLAGSGSSIGDTTITLQSMVGIDGATITDADLGQTNFGTLEPGNGTQEEAFQFTGVTQNANGTATLTGVSTVLFKQPYTATAGLTKIHAGSTTLILSNDAAFYNNLINYINNTASSGAALATTSVAGLVQLATTAQINAGTATGSSGASLAITPNQLASSQYATFFVPTGMILPYGGTGAPVGYLPCDGTAYSTGTYVSLFQVIGTSYGSGTAANLFQVPDLRSRSLVGAGTGTTTMTITSVTGNVITVTTPTGPANSVNNEVQNGQPIVFNASVAGNLANATTYYIVRTAFNKFSLATSLSNAIGTGNGTSGTSTVITLAGTEAGTFTLSLSARARGDYGGEENHGLVLGELASHAHDIKGASTTNSTFPLLTGVNGNSTSGQGSAVSGGNQQHNTMMPYGVASMVIKT